MHFYFNSGSSLLHLDEINPLWLYWYERKSTPSRKEGGLQGSVIIKHGYLYQWGPHVIGSSYSKLGTCRSLLVICFCQSLSEWWKSHWQDDYYDLSLSISLYLSVSVCLLSFLSSLYETLSFIHVNPRIFLLKLDIVIQISWKYILHYFSIKINHNSTLIIVTMQSNYSFIFLNH